MKKFGLLKLLIMFFILCNINLLIAEELPHDMEIIHPIYGGVSFIIRRSVVKDFKDFMKDTIFLAGLTSNQRERIPKSLEVILDNLIVRFSEAVSQYNKNKGKLPSCLSEALDNFFTALKRDEQNSSQEEEKTLKIEWWKDEDTKWNELGPFIGDKFVEGISKSDKLIQIINAYGYSYKGESKEILTASLLLHELIHSVKKAYPDCFKKYKDKEASMEEATTEDGTWRVFDKSNSSTIYWDYYRLGTAENDCTYDNVCLCKKGCLGGPKERLSSADECEQPPPDEPAAGDDSPDDNYSFSSGSLSAYDIAPEAIIYTRGHYKEALKLFGGLEFDGDNTAEKLLEVTPFLIIPSSGLSGEEYNSTFKYILEKYVLLGGTIIVLSQKYGDDIDNILPKPEGQSLSSFGYREDQSCLRNSVYFDAIHPILSSSTNQLLDAGVDGYFSSYPAGSTILLRRKINQQPALLYYPYGDNGGKVVVTGLFSDLAASRGQLSAAEKRVMRDLITWARNTRLPIPIYDLAKENNPEIVLNVKIANRTEKMAAKARLLVSTPDRSKMLYENEASIYLNGGEETEVPLVFTLPDVTTADYGICHLDYELYDSENNLIQMAQESDSGRFSIYKITTPLNINDGFLQWVTVKSETVYYNEAIECAVHFKNNTDQTRTIDMSRGFFLFGHFDEIAFEPFSVIVSPGQEVVHHLSLPTGGLFSPYSKYPVTFRIQYIDSEGKLHQIGAAKTVFLLGSMTKSTIELNSADNFFAPQGSFSYTVKSQPASYVLPGNNTIKVTIAKYNWTDSQYHEIAAIHETTHDFSLNGDFVYNDIYTPQTIHPEGIYRLQLDVTAPNGVKEITRYQTFRYDRSGLSILLDKIQKDGQIVYSFIPGETYTIPIAIKNYPRNDYEVKNGTCIIVLKSETNREIYRKEIRNISAAPGEEKMLHETFTFNPVGNERYFLEYAFWDETREENLNFKETQSFKYSTGINISTDKVSYEYLDTANVTVRIDGVGNYTIHFSCPEANLDEQRNIQIPAGNYNTMEIFQVPIGFKTVYNVNIEVTDAVNLIYNSNSKITAAPLSFDYSGNFAETYVAAGKPLHYNLNIKRISGFSNPLSGQLKINSPGLNYNEIRNVFIQPAGDNLFSIEIPVSVDIQAGTYVIDAGLIIDNVTVISKRYSLILPQSMLQFKKVAGVFNAGDSIPLMIENNGGKDGTFDIEISLKDQVGKNIIDHKETRNIAAGEQYSFSIVVPQLVRNGEYILVQKGIEATTNRQFNLYSALQIIGLEADLKSYTLKERFFDNEYITGKSEITAGSGEITGGNLQAKIIKYVQSQGLVEIKAGNFVDYNMIEAGFDNGSKLYLSTDMGIVAYDKATSSANLIYDPGYNCNDMTVTTQGEIWIGTYSGAFRFDTSGNWTRYTTAEGLLSENIKDILEADLTGSPAVWLGTGSGISVFSQGAWKSFTTANGLPSNWIYCLAKDNTGAVWASTSGGVRKYNGQSFVSVSAPFGNTSVGTLLTSTDDGSIWLMTSLKLYRCRPGSQWDEWSISSLYPPNILTVYDLETSGNSIWIRANYRGTDNKYHKILIKYNTAFEVFDDTQVTTLQGLDNITVIPGRGDEAYFTLEFGFLEYKENTWTAKELNKDMDRLAGEIVCMASDQEGNIWAGTRDGISKYDGRKFTNYCASAGRRFLFDIKDITLGIDNSVYAVHPYEVIKVTNDNMETTGISDEMYSGVNINYAKIAVDGLGRIWLGERYLYSYDGAWSKFANVKYVRAMENDINNGIWVGAWDASAQFYLTHIKNDFTQVDYTPTNSGMLPGDRDLLYMDKESILWLKKAGYQDGYTTGGKLQSFDGSNWIDYSVYEGFPVKGVVYVVKDDAGKLQAIDPDDNLYYLSGGKFTFTRVIDNHSHSLVSGKGKLYCAGGERYYAGGESGWIYPKNLLEISSQAGIVEEDYWTQNYEVNISPGTTATLDLLTGKNLTAGSYVLKTELFSSLEQVLAESSYPFIVRASGLSLTLSGVHRTPYIKTGSPLTTNIEILNNTPNDYSNLKYTLKKTSPSGTTEILRDETINLTIGGSYTDSITFNETEIGSWYLTAELGEESSGGGEAPPPMLTESTAGITSNVSKDATAESLTSIAQSQMLIEVAQPQLNLEVQAPQYAGDEPYDFKVKLSNTGHIDSDIHILVETQDAQPLKILDEEITLKPGEERALSAANTITADRTYNISITGDVEKQESTTVKYGCVENLIINIQPLYKEGAVNIGYNISNPGGLAFTDDTHFELFQLGGTAPLYTIDRSYTLYPGAETIADLLNFDLAPGNYLLKYSTTKTKGTEIPFTVNPAGIVNITLKGTDKYPIGLNYIGYTITNSDTAAGNININIDINQSAFGDKGAFFEKTAPLTPEKTFNEVRNYYLEPGETREDFIPYDFNTKGDYTLTITGSKLAQPVNQILHVLNPKETTAAISIGEPEANKIPTSVTIQNSGYENFSGSVIIEIDGAPHEELISVISGDTYTGSPSFNTAGLTPGTKEVKAFLYDSAGTLIAQQTASVQVLGADIKVVDFPQNLEINAGSFAEASLRLRNEGHIRGDALLQLNAFDTLDRQVEIALDAGEEIEIGDIFIDAAGDLPNGNYPFYYTLRGSGVENGLLSGNFNFRVNGVSLQVEASLDSSLYNVGETAELTIDISSNTTIDAPLEAVVNWGNYSERKTVTMTSTSERLVFSIPLDEQREDKIFYGIYHEGGKGIHLNDIYLNFRGVVSVELDRQVYAPGETIHAVFTSETPGTLTATCFDESYTIALNSSGTADFLVPEGTTGGTYGVGWEFIPTDTTKANLSGAARFDVSGLIVKTAKCRLEKGKYAPGETIKAEYIFESNMDDALILRSWTTTPTGDWTYHGESSVSVSHQNQVNVQTSYAFNTTYAGTHNMVYGLYKSIDPDKSDTLIVSGSMAFDVGDAVVIGLSTDHFEYKEGNENVTVKVDYFGSGTAQMELFLDEQQVDNRSITIDGAGSTEVILSSSQVSGGRHFLRARITKDGLISEKTTGFIYGSNLPDLTVRIAGSERDGLNYTYKIDVQNSGRTASAATDLVFTDNGGEIGNVSIPVLQPGAVHEGVFNWNGTGRAGSHEFVFTVDSSNVVKEYSESNNSIELKEEVALIYYSLEVDSQVWPANSEVNIQTRLINNQDTVTAVTLNLTIMNDSSGEVIFQRARVEELPAFGSRTLSDTFNTGVYPAGGYTLSQGLSDGNIELQESKQVIIEVTKAIIASVVLSPERILADTDAEVELTVNLKNTGNVVLDDEVLLIEISEIDRNKDKQKFSGGPGGGFLKESPGRRRQEFSDELIFSLLIGEEKTEKKTLVLNLPEGEYELKLKYLEKEVASGSIQVIPAIEREKSLYIKPRVLIMNMKQSPEILFQAAFLSNLFIAQGIEYERAEGVPDSYLKFHKGQANINVVFGNLESSHIDEEMRERVWRGEGLILFCDNPINNPGLVDLFGVKVETAPAKQREQDIEILPSEIGAAGEFQLLEKNKLVLVPQAEDVVIAGCTKIRKQPVMALRKYGSGYILIIAVPLQFNSGIENIAQLLLNSVNKFSQDVYNLSDLARILPLVISITNKGSEEKELVVKEQLPYGVEGFDYNPKPEEGEELKWKLKLAAGSESVISYWLRLPDEIGDYEIKTEIYENENPIDEVMIGFSVEQKLLARIAELIVEIDALEVQGQDLQYLRQAKQMLENIRNRTGKSAGQAQANLLDAVRAAGYIGRVEGIDVSMQLLKVQNAMVVLGRIYYEFYNFK